MDRRPASTTVLTINSGSSSIKFSIHAMGAGGEDTLVCRGSLEGIGRASGRMRVKGGGAEIDRSAAFPAHRDALGELLRWIKRNSLAGTIGAVGHRVVHGGSRHTRAEAVTEGLIADLKRLSPFVPRHLPHEILAIETVDRELPGIPQVCCFDTAFHSSLPRVAYTYALPAELTEGGVRKYGFHGISYEFIMNELGRVAGPEAAAGRVIIAHLGHGSSMAAVKGGSCVDTTMGLTPSGGLVMSTRTGDIDPGVILYLQGEKAMSLEEVNDAINNRGGLLGVSGISADMLELLGLEAGSPRAKDAVELYCYQARKFIASLASALNGVDTVVFTAGIGENSPEIRRRIMAGLEFMGIELDPELNLKGRGRISSRGSKAAVWVIKTDEEVMIARKTFELLRGRG